ncbi:hypothetical protein MJ258_04230 [Legionella sp. EUR-108]|nr:hypothetical protein [Legionella maioricensis]
MMNQSLIFIKKLILIPLLILLWPLSANSDSISFSCQNNVANFDYELQQPLHTKRFVRGWGPARNILRLSSELLTCLNNKDWQRQRVLAAADYWIKQKLNYCHHYLPDYATPLERRDAKHNKGGYCSVAKNIMPGSVYYHQQVRWNYKGTGAETRTNWINNTMWHGMDCSNYTTFLYNFALGLMFSSNIKYQAGQRADKTQNNLSPNQQSGTNVLDNPNAAGKLVCRDNSIEVNHSCAGHGGYLSVIDSSGNKHPGSILSSDLTALHPGDLLFISARRPNNSTAVVHVVMWTGKQVNDAPDAIHSEQIAPNESCPQKDWRPHRGDWIITDSHYQGPDYRILTPCYYLNNLWGVRRVIF